MRSLLQSCGKHIYIYVDILLDRGALNLNIACVYILVHTLEDME